MTRIWTCSVMRCSSRDFSPSTKKTASGKSTGHPELDQCLKALRAGNALVVWRLDRLGHSLSDLVRIVAGREEEISLKSIVEKIETISAAEKLTFFMCLLHWQSLSAT